MRTHHDQASAGRRARSPGRGGARGSATRSPSGGRGRGERAPSRGRGARGGGGGGQRRLASAARRFRDESAHRPRGRASSADVDAAEGRDPRAHGQRTNITRGIGHAVVPRGTRLLDLAEAADRPRPGERFAHDTFPFEMGMQLLPEAFQIDVGCGFGRAQSEAFERFKPEVYGLELGEELLGEMALEELCAPRQLPDGFGRGGMRLCTLNKFRNKALIVVDSYSLGGFGRDRWGAAGHFRVASRGLFYAFEFRLSRAKNLAPHATDLTKADDVS